MGKKYKVNITPTFEKEYKKLKRKFPKIDDDFEKFIDEVEYDGIIGTPIPRIIKDGNKVYKKRMTNISANRGLSGGFRVIEYLFTEDNRIYLLDIYSKSDQENIANSKIKRLIDKDIR